MHNHMKILVPLFVLFLFYGCKQEVQNASEQTELQKKIEDSKVARVAVLEESIEFKLRDEKPHSVMIVGTSLEKEVLDELVLAIYKFNRDTYAERKFSVSFGPLFKSKENKVIRVSSFDDKPAAMAYYKRLLKEVDIFIEQEQLRDEVYAINTYNSKRLQTSQSLEAYQAFFKKEYVNFDSDSLRNNVSVYDLFSNKDTSGFNVCYAMFKDEDMDRNEVQKSINGYNEMHFAHLDLFAFGYPVKNDSIVFRIGRFEKENEAIEYYHHLIEKSDEFGSDSNLKDDLFVISVSNFFTMFSEHAMEDYLKFYKSEYKEKLDL